MSNTYIVNTIKYERFIECIRKGVYGLSEGMLRKLGSFLKNSCENDMLFLKLSSLPQMIAGPFYITDQPQNLIIEKAYGKCFKISTNQISYHLPWWIAEGFNWLIFFKEKPDSKYTEVIGNINIPNLGKLSESVLNNLLQYMNENGKSLKGLINDRTTN